MESLKMAKIAAFALDDKLGKDIKVIDIEEISTLGDYFVMATGSSSTQVKALSDSVEMKLKEAGIMPSRIEGYRSNGWILLDYHTVVIHVFTEEAREFYDLDRLWSDGKFVELDFTKEI